MKMIGLAAVAALAAMAVLGASTASANGSTVLCTKHEDPCAPANQVKHIHAEAKKPELLTLGFVHTTVTCDSSLALAESLGLANPLVLHLLQLTWTNCSDSEGSCNVATKKLGLFLVLRTGLDLGTVQVHDTEVLVECESSGLHCVYGALPTFSAQGASYGGNGRLIANKALVERVSGFFCPSTAHWTASYESLPGPIYIST